MNTSNDSMIAGAGEVASKGSPNEQSFRDKGVHVSLTYEKLDPTAMIGEVKSDQAGAVLLFAGCTRDSFEEKPVTHLAYSSYAPLAFRSMRSIANAVRDNHDLISIAITHRLGRVEIGEESILIAVSSAHRKAAFEAGEECLEKVKQDVEIWKEEWFADGGFWRANRDGKIGILVESPTKVCTQ